MTVTDAARVLGVPVGTVRRWIREGAPVARRGRRGRGCATTVDVEAVRAWRDAVERDDCGALLLELVEVIPGTLADAALQAFADASPSTQGGGERDRLRAAIGNAVRLSSARLIQYVEAKTNGRD